MTVLVSYATQHGSTKEIAERVGERLRAAGVAAEVRAMTEVRDLQPYDAFVLGSAVHDQAWLPEASDFLGRHHAVLVERPVWLFSVGMPAALRGPWKKFATKEEAALSAELRKSLQPRGHRLFSGVFRAEHIPRPGRLLFRVVGGRYGDYRDWAEIEAWADEVARRLVTVP
ncbi:flavodoxin domain-containing protein [Actinocorallia sp. B10E7]|uniref:flavodoxin domain-containing protein n=1 Tax=Actinocorallia sp. B10E7 TaxID=3153558 RepID=UPI00325F4D98